MKLLYSIIIIILVQYFSVIAQVEIKKFSPGGIFEIRELGAMIINENNKLVVDMIIPNENRPKEYQEVDLRKGDEIMMVNGNRMKSVSDCKNLYEKLEIGLDFKMGISREGVIFIIVFKKADPKTLPVMKRIVINEPGKAGVIPLPALGILLKEKNNKVVVDDVWENAASILKKEIKKEDYLTKLNGKEIINASQFSEQFGKINVGDDLIIDFLRNGKTISVNIKKPEPINKVIIKK